MKISNYARPGSAAVNAPATPGGTGGSLGSITDGTTTVSPVATVDFTSGATVSDLGGGVAGVAVTGGMANPMTTQDDIIVGGASPAGGPTRLGKGSDGQVLTVDPVTHHLVWATPSGASPLTTKGDLFGHSTVDARVPIGTDGQVLTADSTQALGLKWAAASGGMTNPMTTVGDIIVGGTVTGGVAAPARLGVGGANTLLHGGTTPAYSAVVPADLDVTADNTTANATTGHHGLLAKLGGGTTNYLRADGTWSDPSAGSSGSVPAGLYGLCGWFAADKLTGYVDGDPVTVWPNLIVGGYDLVGVGTTMPTYKTNIINSLPIIRFGASGVNNYYTFFLPAMAAQGMSFVVVFKMTGMTNAYTGIIGYGATDAGGFFIKSNGKTAEYYSGSSQDGGGAVTLVTGTFYYATAVHWHQSGGFDRISGTNDNTGLNWPSSNGSQSSGYIGNQAVGGRNLNGDIAEVLVYSRPLSSSDVTSIESYITTKYAL